MTATITKGSVTETKNFTVTVIKKEAEAGACQVNYYIRDQWDTGFVTDVTITNQIGNLAGWKVTFSFPSGQQVTNLWNGIATQTGEFLEVLNENDNANINKGENIEFGFQGTHNGTNDIPTDIRVTKTST